MKLVFKRFHELDQERLYEILRLRSEVFVVEQNCAYQDLDNKDFDAIHVLGIQDSKLIGYARVLAPGNYFGTAAIGRVLIAEKFRNLGLGHLLMTKSIEAVEKFYKSGQISLSAQNHLTGFYRSHGFKEKGEVYLEDGIPHILMERNQ